jgi:CRISPR-associated protein Cas5/CasD subtype I-E
MKRHLLMRLQAPLIAFGGEAIDRYGVIRDFPAQSMLTGLFANALGWRYEDVALDNRLQERLVFGARLEAISDRITEFQTAKLAKDDRGWTTRGVPEGRDGGDATYESPHLRYRDFLCDANVLVALRLVPAEEAPALDDLAAALDRPARPRFLARKIRASYWAPPRCVVDLAVLKIRSIRFLMGLMMGQIKKRPGGRLFITVLAEGVRFELTEDSHPRRFSRPVP